MKTTDLLRGNRASSFLESDARSSISSVKSIHTNPNAVRPSGQLSGEVPEILVVQGEIRAGDILRIASPTQNSVPKTLQNNLRGITSGEQELLADSFYNASFKANRKSFNESVYNFDH